VLPNIDSELKFVPTLTVAAGLRQDARFNEMIHMIRADADALQVADRDDREDVIGSRSGAMGKRSRANLRNSR